MGPEIRVLRTTVATLFGAFIGAFVTVSAVAAGLPIREHRGLAAIAIVATTGGNQKRHSEECL